MVRWVMIAIALLGFTLAFGTQSMGVLAFGLLLGCGGLVGALLAFAAARVESTGAQSSRELSVVLEARKHKAARPDRGSAGSTSTVGYTAAGETGGRGKGSSQDDRTNDGADGGSDGGGDGGGGD